MKKIKQLFCKHIYIEGHKVAWGESPWGGKLKEYSQRFVCYKCQKILKIRIKP